MRCVPESGRCRHDPLCELFASMQQTVERDGARDRAVVKEKDDRLARRKALPVRTRGVDASSADVAASSRCGLRGGEDGKGDVVIGERFERRKIDPRFGEPHPFRCSPEPVLEVADPPSHLARFLLARGERKDGVVVRLCDGGAVSSEPPSALAVRFENGLVDRRPLLLQPGQECRAEIEAHAAVVINDRNDAIVRI